MKIDNKFPTETLRQKAEKLFKGRQGQRIQPQSEAEMLGLIQELELQKLEFEIQNEEILQADQILQSDEVKYRSAIENMLDTFYEATIHGILLDISPSIQIISKGQYTRAELIGKSLISFYSDQNERDSFLSELFKHGKVTDYELKILNKDGSVIPVAISSSLLYENGIPVKITGIMRDITERKLTENALLESERRYRSLADSGQALIWTATPDKKCNYFNQVWLNFTGRTMAQENGDGWAEGVHPDDLDRCFEIYSTFFDRREPFSMDYRLRHHDGEYRWLQDNGTPQFDSEGLFVGYIGHCLDISELKLAEEALRRSEEKYRNIFINAQEGVFQTSVDGTYISINPALAKMYGFDTPEELMNSRFDIAQDAYSDPRERENFIRLMEDQGFVKGYEYEVKQKDGQKVWFYEDAKAIKDEQGKILFFEGFVVDITERK
jgi:two-component system CheB/CheR fusion protein